MPVPGTEEKAEEGSLPKPWLAGRKGTVETLLRTASTKKNNDTLSSAHRQQQRQSPLLLLHGIPAKEETALLDDNKIPQDVQVDANLMGDEDEDDDVDVDEEEEAEYLNEEEEEALFNFFNQTSPNELILSDDLASVTEETLARLYPSQQVQSIYMDRVMLRVRAAEQENQEPLEHPEEEEEDERGIPATHHDKEIPNLCCESSNGSAFLVLERLDQALTLNTSVTHVTLNACHPKVIETVLWGISSSRCNLVHLALDMWWHQSHGGMRNHRRSREEEAGAEPGKFTIWEALVDVLTHKSIQTLYIGNYHGDQSSGTAMNWNLLATGIGQNRSLTSITIETLSWTDEATRVLCHALSCHPQLRHSEFLYDQNSTRVTIRRQPYDDKSKDNNDDDDNDDEVLLIRAAGTGGPLEDATNNTNTNQSTLSKPAKLFKTVSEDVVVSALSL